jgi:predicted metal-binding membrane protein
MRGFVNLDKRAAPAPVDRPLRSGVLLPVRDLAGAWAVVVVIAASAWLLTVAQSRDMGVEPGTMGLGVPLFLAMWLAMMTAMMLPSLAPVAVTWASAIVRRTSGMRRALRIGEFTAGYLIAWTAFGVLAYLGLAVTGDWARNDETAGRAVGVAAFGLAGLYQFGPVKDICLRHCRSPMAQLMRYANFRPRLRDLRVGAHHGAYCVGCCWALMVLLIPVGVMNIAAMAAIAVLVFLEKLWRHGQALARVAGVAFLVLAVLALFQDWMLPGLQPPGDDMRM